jgi:hypothetical protein
MPRYTIDLQKGSKLHDELVKKIKARAKLAEQEHSTKHDTWRSAEERTLAWIPEQSADAIRRNKRHNDGIPSYTTIQIPYTYAIMMSAHTYWTSVFFARSPIHQFMGRHGEGEQQTQALEALISYQVEVGRMTGPYYIWLYDAAKYGAGIIGCYWDRQKLHYGSLVEMADPNNPNGPPVLYQTTQEIEGYVGNNVYNVSIWDFMHDPRVSLKNFQKGEFCMARLRLGWNHVVRRVDAGYYVQKQVEQLRNRDPVDRTTSQASDVLKRPQFDRALYGDDRTDKNNHPAGFLGWEFYVELIPAEWGVGSTKFPQKWCFTVSDDYDLILGATPLGYVHCEFPFDIIESEVEGYGLYSRGIPEIMESVQNTVDWLINTHFYNVRSALNNQFIVDPSKLVVKDIQNSGPGFVWRLRPEAYGTDIDKMFRQVQVQDVTQNHLRDFQAMLGVGERTLGINDQIMGSLSGSGRKTATEVRTSTGFGVNRQKTITEWMSATGFSPHAQKMVQNSQQFYDAQAKLKRVGGLALEAGDRFLNVSPEDIAGFFDFVPVDGTLPIDRMAQANLWKELMANVRNMPPQVAMGYDWGRIFAWAAQIGGLKNIQQFKIQVVPNQQIAQQAQAGNVIPMIPKPGGSGIEPGNSASTAAGLNALGGVSGPTG